MTTNDYLEVTIDSSLIDSDLTNFPVGIKLDASDSILSGLSSTDWQYLHATVLGIECFVEVDIWDMVNEIALIWVNVPTVSSSIDTVIKLQFTSDNNHYVGIATPTTIDDFTGTDSDPPNTTLWRLPITASILSNKLRITNSSLKTGEVISKFILSGDFDVQIDYTNIVYPNIAGWSASFQCVNLVNSKIVQNTRRYDSGQKYHAEYNDGSWHTIASVATSDISGKLRLVRSGNSVTCYYYNSGWISLGSYTSFGSEATYFILNMAYYSPYTAGTVDYDNFIINSADAKYLYVAETGEAPNVWDDYFVGVWHMSQDPSASNLLDSTFVNNNGVSSGSMTSGDLVDGGFGKAIDFDGIDDEFIFPYVTRLVGMEALSLEAYSKFYSHAAFEKVLDLDSSVTSNTARHYRIQFEGTNTYLLVRLDDSSNTLISTPTEASAIVLDTYNHHVFTYDGLSNSDSAKAFIDGVLSASTSATGNNISSVATNVRFVIGNNSTGSGYINGQISDIRISKIDRSAGWIKATYYVLSDGLLSKELIEVTSPVGTTIFGQISINGKYVNIIGVSLVEKGQWRTVEDIYILNDGDWRQNIIS